VNKATLENILKDYDVGSILWTLYAWENEWYGINQLSKYSDVRVNVCRKVVKQMVINQLLTKTKSYSNEICVISYFLKDDIRILMQSLNIGGK